MTDRELRKLSRAELLELLLEESRENERLRAQLQEMNEKLADRAIRIERAGSIAEAALQLNGVFQAAEEAAAQYLENVRRLAVNRSLSSRQKKKQKVFSRISDMRSWFSFMQLPASCGNPLVQGSLADADAAGSCSNE